MLDVPSWGGEAGSESAAGLKMKPRMRLRTPTWTQINADPFADADVKQKGRRNRLPHSRCARFKKKLRT